MLLRRLGWAILIGTPIAAVIALTHLSAGVQFGGADGYVLPSWVVLILTPVALFLGITILQLAAIVDTRKRVRRLERRNRSD